MNEQGSHEKKDFTFQTIRFLAFSSWGLIIGSLIFCGALYIYFSHERKRKDQRPLFAGREAPPEPRLQANAAADLAEMRKAEDRILSTYGWVDRAAGIVRLPIDRAMDLISKEGLPTRKQNAAK